MGFWSKLGKGLMIGGGALAAPFSGGTSLMGSLAAAGIGTAGKAISSAAGGGNQGGSPGDAVSAGLGGYAKGAAANRGTELEARMDLNKQLEDQLLARESEKRTARAAAYRDSMVGQHTYNFEPAARPSSITTPSYVTTERNINDSVGNQHKTGTTLFEQAMSRLNQPDLTTPGGMPAYHDLTQDPRVMGLLKPGAGERIAGIGSAVSPFLAGLPWGKWFGGGNNEGGNGTSFGA